jgi:hypothetical protein
LNFFLGENFSIPENNNFFVEATKVLLPYTCFMKLMKVFWWLATHKSFNKQFNCYWDIKVRQLGGNDDQFQRNRASNA